MPPNLTNRGDESKPWWRRAWIVPVVVGVAALFIGVAIGASGESTNTSSDSPTVITETVERTMTVTTSPETVIETVTETVTEKPEPAPTTASTPQPSRTVEPPGSVSQANARESAGDYLDYSAFSRSGLIDQLKYEGYSLQDATYGVDSLHVNWNEQAAKSAQSYLDYSSFSHSGLVDQLTYEGFTSAQAEYGVTKAGL